MALLFIVCPTLCSAGAWARGTGKAFVSTSTSINWPSGAQLHLPNIYGSAYLEYGLKPHLTLGLDLGTPDITRSDVANAVGFLRYTFTEADAPIQISADIGGGLLNGTPAFRTGASIGRGIRAFETTGWINLDLVHLYAPSSQTRVSKADAVIGLNYDRWSIMATLSLSEQSGTPSTVSLTPSITRQIGTAHKFELGLSFDLSGRDQPSLKLGLWKEF